MSDTALGSWRRKADPTSAGWPVKAGFHLAGFVLARPLSIACALFVFFGASMVVAFATVGSPPSRAALDSVHPTLAPQVLVPAKPTPAWLDIVKPIEIFNLEAADLAKAPKTYSAKRSPSGGGRRDVIALGRLTGEAPAVRLALYRRGSEATTTAPIFADVVRLAAEAGLSVARSGLADLLKTRFGSFEVVALDLARETTAMPCSGFRLIRDQPALTMTGIACGGGKAMARDRLGCLLDRIDLAAGGGDRQLVEFFAASELKRNDACDGMRLGPDTVHAAWLDDQPATPHKNRRRH